MKLNLKRIAILFVVAVTSFAFKSEFEEITGWSLRGSHPESYEIGLENCEDKAGRVAYLKSNAPEGTINKNFGTLMQSFSADYYLNKKLKLTGNIRTKNVESWAGMWMRVDGKRKHSLSFDNMRDRKIKGTTEWTKYEIILDVPKSSTTISYGVLLQGIGSVWLDDLTFEEVSVEVTTTGKNLKMRPTNSSFED
tara:strand:+ start:17969 stop:18550 length:582 start_codon:yes stop_codon:yes gene_type:complete